MYNDFLFNSKLYNYSISIDNIIYASIDDIEANISVYFKYKCNINSGIDDVNSDSTSNLSGVLLISQVDNPSGNININYKYKFNVDSEVDDFNSTIEVLPQSSILDLTQNEVLYTISGANTIFGTPSMATRTLGGLPSWNRIESFLPLRLFPLENMELHFVSGNHSDEIIDINLEINDSSSNYTVQYKDSDSSSYGEQVVVDFGKELKLMNSTNQKYIYIKLNEAPLLEKTEPVQLKNIYNNELILDEFDVNDVKPIYGSFFIINSTEYTLTDMKLYTNDNAKILTEFAREIPVGKEIQTIADINTAPTVDAWYSYTDSTSASVLIDSILPGEVYGIWTKNSLIYDSSSEVSPWEDIVLNIEYIKDTSSAYTDKIQTLTRIYDENLIGKYKVYYNINDTIDGTGTISQILDSTGLFPFEVSDTSSLTDGDFIYYDIVKLNKYGIETIKKFDNYVVYQSDGSGALVLPPIEPENGNILYDSSSNMLINVQYFPENEADITNRAYYWDLSMYKINDSTGNLLLNDIENMDETSGYERNIENLNYTIDSSSLSLLDGTPLIFKIFTKNDSLYSLNSYDISGEYIDKDSVLSPGEVNAFYGRNFGINQSFLENKNETIAINSDIDYVINDNKLIIKYLDTEIFKVIYRGENNIKNIVYLKSDYEVIEDDTFVGDSTTTNVFDRFEVETNTLYFLVNLKRCMAIDFTNKIMYVKSIEHESTVNLDSKFKDTYIFKRYDETILNIFNNKTQKFLPFLQIDDLGNVKNKFKFVNTKNTLDNIV